jgi:hypothetical protein
MNRILTAVFLILLITVTLKAQETDSHEPESNEPENDSAWVTKVFGEWKDTFDSDRAIEKKIPTIELYGGIATPSLHEDVFSGNFGAVDNIGAKLGFIDILRNKHSDDILDYSFNYFSFNHILVGLAAEEPSSPDIEVNAWQFGLGKSDGYGYILGDYTHILLYTDGGIIWTKLDFKDTAQLAEEQGALDRFGDAFRFGTRSEGGIGIRFSKNIGLKAGYERAIVFPRHLFWYWIYSEAVHGIAQGGLSIMTNAIEKSSPELVPVVNFVLRNALSYGIYELRKKNMNWPADTPPPFMFDSFKVGLSFTF